MQSWPILTARSCYANRETATLTIPRNSAKRSAKRYSGVVATKFSKPFTAAASPCRRNRDAMKSGSVLLQLLGGTKRSHALRRWINFWPPFLGAGIRVTHIAPDMKAVDVEMKLRFWNA